MSTNVKFILLDWVFIMGFQLRKFFQHWTREWLWMMIVKVYGRKWVWSIISNYCSIYLKNGGGPWYRFWNTKAPGTCNIWSRSAYFSVSALNSFWGLRCIVVCLWSCVVHASNIVLSNPWSVLAFAMVNNSLLRLITRHCPAPDGRKVMIVDQQFATCEPLWMPGIYKHLQTFFWITLV